jgi:hypothetical protein
MNNLDQLRERFEAWAKSVMDNKFPDLSREGEGYWQARTNTAWHAYQASHISAVKQCAEIAKEVMFTRGLAGTTTSKLLNEAIILLLPKENKDD